MVRRLSWKSMIDHDAPLVLPSAGDALTARLIERAGFPAYQIGGFAMVAAMHAVPTSISNSLAKSMPGHVRSSRLPTCRC